MATVARNPIRALSLRMAAARGLCSAAPEAGGASVQKLPYPLYRRISALRGDPNGSVEETMSEWMKEGKAAAESDLMSIVRELRKFRSYELALELIDWMEKRGMRITFGKHAIRLDLITKVKGIDMAEKYFSSLPEPAKNKHTYGALFNSYCQKKLADKAIALYEKMKELNFTSSTLVYNNLMTLHKNLGQPEKVPALFHEMKENNLSPDRFTYGLLMSSYYLLNDIDSVERVVKEMEEGNQDALDWTIYCNLAAHFNSAGLFKKTQSALKKAEGFMDRRDRNSFHFLLSLYAGSGNLEEVNRVWKLLKAAFQRTTNVSYFHMLHALRRVADVNALKKCFEEWESVYTLYDVRLPNIMIDAYLEKGMIKEAELLWEKAIEKGVGSDTRTMELFTGYYLEKREMGSALKCFKVATQSVKQGGWKPTDEKVEAFLKYFEEEKDVDGAEGFCESLEKLNCLSEEVHESLHRIYTAAGRKEPSLPHKINNIVTGSACANNSEEVKDLEFKTNLEHLEKLRPLCGDT